MWLSSAVLSGTNGKKTRAHWRNGSTPTTGDLLQSSHDRPASLLNIFQYHRPPSTCTRNDSFGRWLQHSSNLLLDLITLLVCLLSLPLISFTAVSWLWRLQQQPCCRLRLFPLLVLWQKVHRSRTLIEETEVTEVLCSECSCRLRPYQRACTEQRRPVWPLLRRSRYDRVLLQLAVFQLTSRASVLPRHLSRLLETPNESFLLRLDQCAHRETQMVVRSLSSYFLLTSGVRKQREASHWN